MAQQPLQHYLNSEKLSHNLGHGETIVGRHPNCKIVLEVKN